MTHARCEEQVGDMLYEYYTGQLLIAKKKKEAKSEKKAETGGFELILLAPGIERSTADPNENVPVGVYLPSPGCLLYTSDAADE